jgi:hypothetical protein
LSAYGKYVQGIADGVFLFVMSRGKVPRGGHALPGLPCAVRYLLPDEVGELAVTGREPRARPFFAGARR